MSIRTLRSPATHENSDVKERERQPGEGNEAWLRRVLGETGLVEATPEWSLLLLVGGRDPLSFRLRVAQSHVRDDLTPSAWSHVAFVPALAPSLGESPTREVSLAPAACFGESGFPVPTNGLQQGRLAPYLEAEAFPNIALLSVPVASERIGHTLDGLRRQRNVLDVPQLILRWLAYGWGVGVPASPLGEGLGIPAAAVLEVAFAAQGFDLTPGLESRSSCPEAIWQAARWWHEFYAQTYRRPADPPRPVSPPGQPTPQAPAPVPEAIKGAYTALHNLVPEPPAAEPATPPSGSAPAAGARAPRRRGR
jgi:hypothetical protein